MIALGRVEIVRMCGSRFPRDLRYWRTPVRRVPGGVVFDVVGLGVWRRRG